MSDTLFSGQPNDSGIKVILRAADGRFIRRLRRRVQLLCASSDPLPSQPDAIFEVFRARNGRISLRFDDPAWNRAVEIGDQNHLWADGPEISSDPAKREKLPIKCQFALESTGDLGDHPFRIRGTNDKYWAPNDSGEFPGHLEANSTDAHPGTLFYISRLY